MTRQLYLWHRYVGIGLALPFALWFATGVVMLYAQFPILTPAARFQDLPQFDPARFSLTPHAAVERAGLAEPARRIRPGPPARPADLLHPPGRQALAGRVCGHRPRPGCGR